MNRRGFLQTCLIACAAPAIVRADSLMRIVPLETTIWTPEAEHCYQLAKQQLADDRACRGMIRELSQYDMERKGTIYRLDVAGIGLDGQWQQIGIDATYRSKADYLKERPMLLAMLKADVKREGIRPGRDGLEIPSGVLGSFL